MLGFFIQEESITFLLDKGNIGFHFRQGLGASRVFFILLGLFNKL
ncbi:MAG: hypothetical protein K0R55_150 [Sporomusa sp.]|nr:hypothetical protein [Sporomusa sp.]